MSHEHAASLSTAESAEHYGKTSTNDDDDDDDDNDDMVRWNHVRTEYRARERAFHR
ncbi:uncharacterized protein H6S33_001050 [Morchella sextelata]|uniref:uncharacterized protein n=1 Tax=Morchella sextelata TaxID=1174677 RepID=UPI001D053889|nr:uncharacterized protein H6S33_001050 [Morchella sextelata]KAH0608822.1 hypothetical protein H6S33_001050 [Morchella sextelata]